MIAPLICMIRQFFIRIVLTNHCWNFRLFENRCIFIHKQMISSIRSQFVYNSKNKKIIFSKLIILQFHQLRKFITQIKPDFLINLVISCAFIEIWFVVYSNKWNIMKLTSFDETKFDLFPTSLFLLTDSIFHSIKFMDLFLE